MHETKLFHFKHWNSVKFVRFPVEPCKLNDDTKKNMFGKNEFRKGIVGLYTSKDAPKRKCLLGGIGLSSTISAGLGVKVTTEVCRYWEAKETKSQTSKHQHVLYGGCPQGAYM